MTMLEEALVCSYLNDIVNSLEGVLLSRTSKNSKNIHGGSQNNIEAPHDFILNFWKGLAWFQDRI